MGKGGYLIRSTERLIEQSSDESSFASGGLGGIGTVAEQSVWRHGQRSSSAVYA